MLAWPQQVEHGLTVRTCEHGIGHPDPDDAKAEGYQHPCDGCCARKHTVRAVRAALVANGDAVMLHAATLLEPLERPRSELMERDLEDIEFFIERFHNTVHRILEGPIANAKYIPNDCEAASALSDVLHEIERELRRVF